MVMTLDQQAGFFPDRQRDRAEHAGHALGLEPAFGRGDQGGAGFGIFRLEQAEIAGARTHALFDRLGQRQLVEMRGNAADHLVSAPGEEILSLGMVEEGILARRQQAVDFGLERRHPIGIIGVEPPGQVDKGLEIGLGGNGGDEEIG